MHGFVTVIRNWNPEVISLKTEQAGMDVMLQTKDWKCPVRIPAGSSATLPEVSCGSSECCQSHAAIESRLCYDSSFQIHSSVSFIRDQTIDATYSNILVAS